MNKKIDVFINGKYELSSNRYKTCKAAITAIKKKASIFITGRVYTKGNNSIIINKKDKITAHFAK